MNEKGNTIRGRLAANNVTIGGWIQIPHPVVARLMASSGFDWIAVDAEHGAVDLETASVLFRTIADAGSVPLVRLPGNDYAVTKRYLDAGAEGVIAPLINTRAEAEDLVRATKYPPDGERGVGYCAANLYGFEFDAYLERANRDILTCVQIEHAAAIANLEGILTVPGVDAAFIGPYDLSASLGITAQFEDARYKAALTAFLAGCHAHGVAPGIHVVAPNPAAVAQRIREGYRMIAYSLDVTLLGTACRDGMGQIRELVDTENRRNT